MNIYRYKNNWKFMLIFSGLLIIAGSMVYTNILVKNLAREERKKVELWALATKEMGITENSQFLEFLLEVQKINETIPLIITDDNDSISLTKNLNLPEKNPNQRLQKIFEQMKEGNEPIEIPFTEDENLYVYYKDSTLLSQLYFYPFVQLGIIVIFGAIAYFAFHTARKSEQNMVWLGMAKETAHQLGTPLSSLMGWIEILKDEVGEERVKEMQRDIDRLNIITERFSKIGSKPYLTDTKIKNALDEALSYLQRRTSRKVTFTVNYEIDDSTETPLNFPLFSWVVENITKNAIDAMKGVGQITFTVLSKNGHAAIDIHDQGKGIPSGDFKAIFKPGYTTKQRGWGLGLSLAKRIIENYHQGKIFVKSSEINGGTTFRILLPKKNEK